MLSPATIEKTLAWLNLHLILIIYRYFYYFIYRSLVVCRGIYISKSVVITTTVLCWVIPMAVTAADMVFLYPNILINPRDTEVYFTNFKANLAIIEMGIHEYIHKI